jgi:hypothetical protein
MEDLMSAADVVAVSMLLVCGLVALTFIRVVNALDAPADSR